MMTYSTILAAKAAFMTKNDNFKHLLDEWNICDLGMLFQPNYVYNTYEVNFVILFLIYTIVTFFLRTQHGYVLRFWVIWDHNKPGVFFLPNCATENFSCTAITWNLNTERRIVMMYQIRCDMTHFDC